MQDETVPVTDEETPVLTGVPDGGGIRQAFRGLSLLRVPSPRSVVTTACALVALLLGASAVLVAVDTVLERTLAASRLGSAGLFGLLGLLTGTVSLGLLVRVALDAPTQPPAVVERRPLRLMVGLVLLVVSCGCALLWARGLAAV